MMCLAVLVMNGSLSSWVRASDGICLSGSQRESRTRILFARCFSFRADSGGERKKSGVIVETGPQPFNL